MLAVFTFTIFLGAAMLFLVQPMAAKMVLPLLGGSPSVWNTCMVFFQALLLAGYAYAHYSVKVLGVRRQVVVHVGVAAAPLVLWMLGMAPLAAPTGGPGAGDRPVAWLLMMLLVCVGPAFFVLSTCGTLMQRWFAGTGHVAARDPYFLYAASNGGSMLALLAYPLVVEPWMSLGEQRRWWSMAYVAFVVATVVCGVLTWRRRDRAGVETGAVAAKTAAPTWKQRGMWVVLAAVPSSLMLAVTQYLSTDVAAIPLLWIVPLAIYLLTFILVFAKRVLVPVRVASRSLPVLVLALSVIVLLARHNPIWIIVVLNLATLFFGAVLCHGRLAASRPDASHLTAFYLCLALGGVLGGLFNAIAAPMLFDTLLEYPIVLAAVCLLRPGQERKGNRALRAWMDAGTAAIPVGLMALAMAMWPWVGRLVSGAGAEHVRNALVVGVPVVACYFLVHVPVRFAAAVLALFLVDAAMDSRRAEAQVRTFFGRYSVHRTATPQGRVSVELRHGTTLHGSQWESATHRDEPLIYYHTQGPVGDVFAAYGAKPLFDRVGLVGLGTGSIAAYGREGQELRFFEIDPAVVRLSSAGGHFHYVERSKARCEFVMGDARLSIANEADGSLGAILLDAFSSDAVPVHLLTREAVKLYMSKLRPGGVVVFHVSNRYLELEPVVSGVTRDLGLVAAMRNDAVPDAESKSTLHFGSNWIAAARTREDLAPLLKRVGWEVMEARPGDRVWTDDFSSFVGIFQWSGSR